MFRYIILLIIAGIVGSIIATRKGRSPILWGILCAIVPLLIAVIIVLPPLVSKGYTKNVLTVQRSLRKMQIFENPVKPEQKGNE